MQHSDTMKKVFGCLSKRVSCKIGVANGYAYEAYIFVWFNNVFWDHCQRLIME